jgi:hypothetical protein
LADSFTKPVSAERLKAFRYNLNVIVKGWDWGGVLRYVTARPSFCV